MQIAILRQGVLCAALFVTAILSGCASERAAEEQALAVRAAAEAAAVASRPKPVSLNDSVIQSAAIYLTFTRDMATLEGGFADPEAIQAALRRGSAYDPDQISRGLVAYASILALQSPEFVTGVRQSGMTPAARNQTVARIVADPSYASTLPGADVAAGLIIAVMDADIDALRDAADSIENDAYAIQADGRQVWARAPVPNREGRLEAAKNSSARAMLASAEETARLSAAAYGGSGLGVTSPRRRTPPYPSAVTSALALAALAALDGAGENARANTDALQYDRASQDCFASSKLNLFQCLAASRPSYEDVFCLGRHVVRDLGSCARGAALPAGVITVGAPVQNRVQSPVPEPSILPGQVVVPAPTLQSPPRAPIAQADPVQTQPPRPAPSASSPTQRLNSTAPAPES